MESVTDITFRARRVLYAVISEYVATGEPVSSRRIARRYGLNLSPATIRNVLADLEDAGYLTHPHTSAGRVPTERGFRLFVDALVQMREVNAQDRESIRRRMQELKQETRPEFENVMREAGKMLSSLTSAATVVTRRTAEEEALAQLRFIPMPQGSLLAVLISRSGTVQNRVVNVSNSMVATDLDLIHNYLGPLIEGKTLEELRDLIARDIEREESSYFNIKQQSIALVDAALAREESQDVLLIEGQGFLFSRPEFADGDKIKAFLRTFESKKELVELLNRTIQAGSVNILIGTETALENLNDHDVSVISAPYGHGNTTGAVAVVGPARMDYGKVVPLVELTANVVGEALEHSIKNTPPDNA